MAFSYTARHARHARHERHARACASSPRIARVITAPLPRGHPCARAAAAAALSRLLACSRARRRRRTVIRTSCVSRASRARARASSLSRHLLAPLPLKCAPFAAVSSSLLLSSLSSSLSSSLRALIGALGCIRLPCVYWSRFPSPLFLPPLAWYVAPCCVRGFRRACRRGETLLRAPRLLHANFRNARGKLS